MRTQHIIASILLAICGLFIHVSANDIGNGVTDTTTSVGGCKRSSPSSSPS